MNIVALPPPRSAPLEGPNEALIEALELMLADARAGTLTKFVSMMVHNDNYRVVCSTSVSEAIMLSALLAHHFAAAALSP